MEICNLELHKAEKPRSHPIRITISDIYNCWQPFYLQDSIGNQAPLRYGVF